MQRFDATLGCFMHFHVLVPDGVFARADAEGVIGFREGAPPTRADLAPSPRVEFSGRSGNRRSCLWNVFMATFRRILVS